MSLISIHITSHKYNNTFLISVHSGINTANTIRSFLLIFDSLLKLLVNIDVYYLIHCCLVQYSENNQIAIDVAGWFFSEHSKKYNFMDIFPGMWFLTGQLNGEFTSKPLARWYLKFTIRRKCQRRDDATMLWKTFYVILETVQSFQAYALPEMLFRITYS